MVFVISPTGLRAVSGGKTLLTLVDAPFDKDAYGDYSAVDGVYWYVNGGKLFAIDLREPTAEPLLVANGVIDDRLVFISRTQYVPGTKQAQQHSVLLVATLGTITNHEKALLAGVSWGSQPAAKHPLKLVASDWLAAQAQRRMDSKPALSWEREWNDAPGLSDDFRECFDMDVCAGARDFGSMGWKYFQSKSECDGVCVASCLLFDPKSKHVAVPAPKPSWSDYFELEDRPDEPAGEPGSCGPYHFDQSGTYYYLRTTQHLCQLGVGCVDAGGLLAGFLRPGHIVLPVGDN